MLEVEVSALVTRAGGRTLAPNAILLLAAGKLAPTLGFARVDESGF
jgi:hypothetical protein